MLLLSLLTSLAFAEPVTYNLDAGQSWLFVVVLNDTSAMASRMGHDHGVKSTDFTGTVTWDADDPSACNISIDVPVSGLRPDPAGLRERAGLDPGGAVGAGALETITNNFLGKRQLYASSFPVISYRSTSCSGADGSFKVTGDLTIRDVSKSVSTTMTVTADGADFSAKGTFDLNHSDFNFNPFSNLGGALRNLDKLSFTADVKGKS
jgi:polyisoprenoid-binding protein YceI